MPSKKELTELCSSYERDMGVYETSGCRDQGALQRLIKLAKPLREAGIMVDPYNPDNVAAGEWIAKNDPPWGSSSLQKDTPSASGRTSQSWGMLPIRIALGAIMFAHGAQKVFGVWGGPGFNQWINQPAPLVDMRPAWLWMGAAALSEFIGGALVMIGLYTRAAAFFIACVMMVAIFGVHWKNGFFIGSGGFEYPLALLGMAVALMIYGGGSASIDLQKQIGK